MTDSPDLCNDVFSEGSAPVRELFDKLLEEGEAGIDRLVAERTQETVTLDFKEKVTASHGEIEKKDRQILGKVLSAFSNSTGGLVIYGVEAKPGPDKVDCAQSLKPICDIERFEVEVRRATGELLQPRHDGIEVRSIASETDKRSGYLLIRVERSERRPHRSEATGDEFYFKRGGDSSYKMQHFDIEDMFRRISAPDLMLSISRLDQVEYGSRKYQPIALQLFNSSNTTARYPYVHVGQLLNCNINSFAPTKFIQGKLKHFHTFSGTSDDVINPGVMIVAGLLMVQIRGFDGVDPPSIGQNDNIGFHWQFGCENTRAKQGTFLFQLGSMPEDNLVVAL